MNVNAGDEYRYDDHIEVRFDEFNAAFKFETYLWDGELAVVLTGIGDDERIASCICYPKEGYIESFMTEEEHRNQGYGELLLSHVIKEYGVNSLMVAVSNLPAIALYQKLGFQWTSLEVNEGGEIYRKMVLS